MEKLDKFLELYTMMEQSGDVCKMKAFGEADKCVFALLERSNPDIAQKWIDMLEPLRWNNYISKDEYDSIASKLINQDESKGPKWSRDQIKSFLDANDLDIEYEYYWNMYALMLMMNVLYSDHSESVRKYVPEDQIPMFFYEQAVEKLEDPDRKNFIRSYFNL